MSRKIVLQRRKAGAELVSDIKLVPGSHQTALLARAVAKAQLNEFPS